MDKGDLVKRLRVELRRASPVHHYLVESELAGEAADRIEALERQCRASETPLVSGEAEGPARFWQQKCSAYAALREVDLARIEALEAENARLKTALACAGSDIAEVAHNAEVSEMARVDLGRIVSDIGNHVRLSEITRLEAALGEKP